jgi:hypothetical protein
MERKLLIHRSAVKGEKFFYYRFLIILSKIVTRHQIAYGVGEG